MDKKYPKILKPSSQTEKEEEKKVISHLPTKIASRTEFTANMNLPSPKSEISTIIDSNSNSEERSLTLALDELEEANEMLLRLQPDVMALQSDNSQEFEFGGEEFDRLVIRRQIEGDDTIATQLDAKEKKDLLIQKLKNENNNLRSEFKAFELLVKDKYNEKKNEIKTFQILIKEKDEEILFLNQTLKRNGIHLHYA